MPTHQRSFPSRESTVSKIAPCRKSRIVHIVDDQIEDFLFIRFALEKSGFETVFHKSLADLATAYDPVVDGYIVLDVHLGSQDATDVIDHLAKTGGSPTVLLASGDPNSIASAVLYAEERGIAISGRLKKPFSGNQLLEALQSARTENRDVVGIDIRKGIREGWVYPAFQPKLCLQNNRFTGAEMLTRIACPDMEPISIQDFVNEASADQLRDLFLENMAFVVRQSPWFASRAMQVSVNVDLATLSCAQSELLDLMSNAPGCLEHITLEITEGSFQDFRAEHLKTLCKLKLKKVKLSMDDFGTSHSNFGRLFRIAFEEVKIDRSLVNGCGRSPKKQFILRAVINLAHDLKSRVVAEGVESLEDLEWLRAAKCDEAQGFLIGSPMSLRQLAERNQKTLQWPRMQPVFGRFKVPAGNPSP